MQIYLAGPLFSDAERAFLDALAARLRAEGFTCFVPHEAAARLEAPTADAIFRLDYEGLSSSQAMLAWIDGPQVDDGTACEIGVFTQLLRERPTGRKGIVALATDLRLRRRRPALQDDAFNLFVSGAVRSVGHVVWSLDEAVGRLREWRQ